MFVVRGKINGFSQVVYWDGRRPDKVVTSPVNRDRLDRLIGEAVGASPTGPFFLGALEPDYVAYVTILNMFDANNVAQTEGDVPCIPGFQLPPNAVA